MLFVAVPNADIHHSHESAPLFGVDEGFFPRAGRRRRRPSPPSPHQRQREGFHRQRIRLLPLTRCQLNAPSTGSPMAMSSSTLKTRFSASIKASWLFIRRLDRIPIPPPPVLPEAPFVYHHHPAIHRGGAQPNHATRMISPPSSLAIGLRLTQQIDSTGEMGRL